MSGETLLNGRYRLVSQHGSGGMAVIYKAVDQTLGRTVAIKILRPSLTNDPAFIIRFQNEARSIANLTHPNIVTVYDVNTEGATHYMIMEFVDGQDLKKIIRAHGTLTVDRALDYAIQICAGAGYAHRAGIVHADIKPQNVLITKSDVVKLTDFGIAQALSDTQPTTRESVVWGSPHYFAPEQARGEKPSAASDVYSIGIVLFEMLTGRLPYTGANQQELALAHIRDRVPLVTEFNPNVPEQLARVIEKVMSKEPSARYRTADQLGQVLVTYRDRGKERTMGTPAAEASAPPPMPPSIPTVARQPVATPPPPQQRQPTPPPAPPGTGYAAPAGQPGSGYQVPPPASSMPTQRYSVAPEAPSSGQQRLPNVPQPAPSQSYNLPVGTQDSGLQRARENFYGQHDPRVSASAPEEIPPVFDTVNMVLAFLAFVAVGGLIPLYIFVLSARLGG